MDIQLQENFRYLIDEKYHRLQFVPWEQAGFEHGFLDRSFNAAIHPLEHLQDHFRILGKSLSLVRAHQVHGSAVLTFDSQQTIESYQKQQLSEADAVLLVGDGAASQRFAAAVLTADCVPLLLRVVDAPVIAAIHAGWRGAAQGVVTSCVAHLKALGFSAARFEVLIGPSARKCCYEVGPEVIEELSGSVNGFAPEDVATQRQDRYMLDLPLFIRIQLCAGGVLSSNIHDCGICTICDERFFSHRREKALSGRQISYLAVPCTPRTSF